MKLLLLLLLCLEALISLLSIPNLSYAQQLQVGFYQSTCPQAESIVQGVVAQHFSADPSITPALLRMFFHDCFVRGCDASILINSNKNKPSEKIAGPNLTVRGFDIINDAKAALEAQCPSNVSCADIIAVATRDAVALSGGPKYDIPTGRRDGLISDPDLVNLPGPSQTVSEAFEFFSARGFTLEEMVTLLGCHTVGIAHCGFFRDRLFDFNDTGVPDPTMDKQLRRSLAHSCGSKPKQITKDRFTFLDQNTSFAMDNEYYNQVRERKGILQIDQELVFDDSTSGFVAGMASDNEGFLRKLAAALVKLGNVEVLSGTAGEIRKKCGAFNKRK